MKRMIKALSATLLFAAPLPAFAQGMPVHDSANLLQQINAVRQAIQVVAQGKQQIAEAQKLYQDLNKRSEEHTSELQSLMRISYAVFCLKKKNKTKYRQTHIKNTKANQKQRQHEITS